MSGNLCLAFRNECTSKYVRIEANAYKNGNPDFRIILAIASVLMNLRLWGRFCMPLSFKCLILVPWNMFPF